MIIRYIFLINRVLCVIVFSLFVCLLLVLTSFGKIVGEQDSEFKIQNSQFNIRNSKSKEPTDKPESLSDYQNLINGAIFRSPIGLTKVIPAKNIAPIVEPFPFTDETFVSTFHLEGIIWSEDDTCRALIKTSESEESYLVKKGDSIVGFEVESITKNSVILSNKKERIVLQSKYVSE